MKRRDFVAMGATLGAGVTELALLPKQEKEPEPRIEAEVYTSVQKLSWSGDIAFDLVKGEAGDCVGVGNIGHTVILLIWRDFRGVKLWKRLEPRDAYWWMYNPQVIRLIEWREALV